MFILYKFAVMERKASTEGSDEGAICHGCVSPRDPFRIELDTNELLLLICGCLPTETTKSPSLDFGAMVEARRVQNNTSRSTKKGRKGLT